MLSIDAFVSLTSLYITYQPKRNDPNKKRIPHQIHCFDFQRRGLKNKPKIKTPLRRKLSIGLKYTQKIPPKKEKTKRVRIIFAMVW